MAGETIARGLRDVILDTTESSFIDGEFGVLRYRGYNIHDLAQTPRSRRSSTSSSTAPAHRGGAGPAEGALSPHGVGASLLSFEASGASREDIVLESVLLGKDFASNNRRSRWTGCWRASPLAACRQPLRRTRKMEAPGERARAPTTKGRTGCLPTYRSSATPSKESRT